MNTRKKIVAGNWKMNNSIDQSVSLVKDVVDRVGDVHAVDIIVAPVFTALKSVSDNVGESFVQIAGQDFYWEESGAFTGEISPLMLKDAGCKWVIIGHSERRQFFAETDETVNKKTVCALSHGLKPIVCVGETLEERENEETSKVLSRQIRNGLSGIETDHVKDLVIAYEPIWAIGTGKTATPEMAQSAHAHIRAEVADLFGDTIAGGTRILYGGSVKPGNAEELFGMDDIDGGLIGGASLKASDFCAIISAALDEN